MLVQVWLKLMKGMSELINGASPYFCTIDHVQKSYDKIHITAKLIGCRLQHLYNCSCDGPCHNKLTVIDYSIFICLCNRPCHSEVQL